ncbi:hypothetical protein CI109_106032 [Kwoniella shandongensis]|uniref:Uncharacterized protein n=1 Tax=Kwoniella shandongensis TaxID=1734106 RepID=A0A5M6BZJ7_9TREE|nr:uncharacterized protein CI109_003919 [Kwoniella shandongensis]KAA5527660.1 hypothetical protein CI109_003919 [Kwoniella shandongensis]
MSAKTVLITGLNGFLAPHVAITFLENGWHVRGTVRTEAKKTKVISLPGLKRYVDEGKIEVAIVQDLADANWAPVLEGIDAVAHVASPLDFSLTSYQAYAKPAVEGTVNLLKAAASVSSIKAVITISSIVAVYDSLKPPSAHNGKVYTEDDWLPYTEKDAENVEKDNVFPKEYYPMFWYNISKKFAELAAQEFYDEVKPHWSFATLCTPAIFGPAQHVNSPKDFNQHPGGDLATSHLFGLLASGEDSPILPTHIYQAVDVRDAALSAYLAVTKNANGRFLISGGDETNQQIVRIARKARPDLAKFIPKPDPADDGLLPADFYKVDASKSQKVLGIKYRTLEETVTDTVKRFEELGVYQDK